MAKLPAIDEQASRFRKQVKSFYRRLQRELPPVHGLTQTLLHMLALIGKHPEGIRPGELAGGLEMTDSNVAAGLRALEARSLIFRRIDPSDGRKAIVSLSPLGEAAAAEMRQIHYAWMRQAMESLLTADERRILLQAGDLMQRLTDHAVATPPTPVAESPLRVRATRGRAIAPARGARRARQKA